MLVSHRAAFTGMLIACTILFPDPARAQAVIDSTGTRWMGVTPGRYPVGFELRHGVDRSRRINLSDEGTRVGLATWYPAHSSARGTPMTSLDYRLLEFFAPPTDAERRAYEDDEIDAMLAWRHVGIVELTREQARAALRTGGMAVRGRAPARGKFPVVMMLGGRFYLSTTAELLASHGFVVVAPFRFVDQPNDVGANDYPWYLEKQRPRCGVGHDRTAAHRERGSVVD